MPRWRLGPRPALRAVVLGALVLAVTSTAVPAGAASNGSWSIFPFRPATLHGAAPSEFLFSLKAGQSITDAFTLANDTRHTLDFHVYPADGYDISQGGGFALRGYGQRSRGVGAWIRLPKSVGGTYKLAPDTQATVPFTLRVPRDASPGDHAGGIVALNVQSAPGGRAHLHVAVHNGVGVRVYLHVLGPEHPGLQLTDLHVTTSDPPLAFLNGSSRATVRFAVRDTGNTLFTSVEAQAYATDLFGQRVRTFQPKRLEAVLPGSRETITEPLWQSLPVAGPVTVHLDLVAQGVDQHYSSGFWVVPWLLIVLVVVLVLGVVLLIRRRRRRRRAALPAEAAVSE